MDILFFFFQRKGTIATEFPLVPKMIQNDLPPSQIGPPVWIRTRSSSLAHANRPARPFFSSGLLESPLVRHSPLFFFVSLALVDLELSLSSVSAANYTYSPATYCRQEGRDTEENEYSTSILLQLPTANCQLPTANLCPVPIPHSHLSSYFPWVFLSPTLFFKLVRHCPFSPLLGPLVSSVSLLSYLSAFNSSSSSPPLLFGHSPPPLSPPPPRPLNIHI
jgi:hypothetical protein